jgi:hypothetical protein
MASEPEPLLPAAAAATSAITHAAPDTAVLTPLSIVPVASQPVLVPPVQQYCRLRSEFAMMSVLVLLALILILVAKQSTSVSTAVKVWVVAIVLSLVSTAVELPSVLATAGSAWPSFKSLLLLL